MIWIYYAASVYVGSLVITAFFVDLTRLSVFWKETIALFAAVSYIFTFLYKNNEKKKDQQYKEATDWKSEQRSKDIFKELNSLNKKDEGVFTEKDYLKRISLEFESLNINMLRNEKMIKEQYLTAYFREVSQIPSFYNWEEWKATEETISQRMIAQIKGFFNVRGVLNNSDDLLAEFLQERTKHREAKERSLTLVL